MPGMRRFGHQAAENNMLLHSPAVMRLLRWIIRARRATAVWLTLCAALALFLRLTARDALPLDYDEPVYLSIAQGYARGVHAGDWTALQQDAAAENPQLMKLIFGAALLPLPDAPPIPVLPNIEVPADVLRAARTASVLGGALNVAALAALNPLAGLFLAAHSYHAKYTALIMLEAAPALTALLCVLTFQRAQGRWGAWLLLSAALLGLTAAGKYMYCMAALALLANEALTMLARRRPVRALGPVLAWGALSIAGFVAVSPYLWSDPIVRILASLTFHARNTSVSINTDRYVWEQPLAWLGASAPWNSAALPLRFDGALAVLAAVGLPALWRRQRVFALWLLIGIAFLLVYPNKMPQYVLIVATPLCLSAAAALRWLLFRALPALARRMTAVRLARLWAPSLALGAVSLAGVLQLNNNPYSIDPAFQQATQLIQQRMAPDEIAIALLADPAVRGAQLELGWRSWNTLPAQALRARDGMLDYAAAAALLNQYAVGRHGVWLLTHQRVFGDPAENVTTLLQRQTPINGPAFEHELPRDYAVMHFRFDAGYALVAEQPPLNAMTSDSTAGADRALHSEGCAQLIPARVGPLGGTLEVACFWRSQPYIKLPWDTRVRLTLQNAAGQTIVQSEPLIARSGFPWFRYQHMFAGVYPLTLPPGLPPGTYALRVRPFNAAEEIAPALTVQVGID